MATRQFMVVLTEVRPLRPGDPPRDEKRLPENKREVVVVADFAAAQRVFATFCAMPMVKAGGQRAKILPLGGSDLWLTDWSAPLVTRAAANLVSVS